LWLIFGFFSFGVLGLSYLYNRKVAKKPWNLKIDELYRPTVSIIVPTFNEQEVIDYKLKNLEKLNYNKDLMQVIFVDSQSTDSTVNQIQKFVYSNPDIDLKVIIESGRNGKSSALNNALKSCKGDIIVISDADSFWPHDILTKSLPYLSDPTIGAVSGPKILLNDKSSSAGKSEKDYLFSMNLMKLGESKKSSTNLFEGGFSAYKRQVLDSFDPYETGSDDCGTVIRTIEKGYRAIMVSEGRFFTTFPETWRGKMEIKMRRANQLLKVFSKYTSLLLAGKIKSGKGNILKNLTVYLLAPWFFLSFAAATIYLFIAFPLTIFILLLFVVPKVNTYLIEVIVNYLVLVSAAVSGVSGKRFMLWKKPQDRALFTEEMLLREKLI
jgi:biofilm PGA synthesis N-glycosyltransferase PgaC